MSHKQSPQPTTIRILRKTVFYPILYPHTEQEEIDAKWLGKEREKKKKRKKILIVGCNMLDRLSLVVLLKFDLVSTIVE